MKINEKKYVEFLEKHIGDNYKMFDLLKESGSCETENDELIIDLKLDRQARVIAEKNGFRFNSHHRDNVCWGMPWVYDFYIELADVEKDIARINAKGEPWKKKGLIEDEYGIRDAQGDLVLGFRTTIPAKIKELYDQICEEIDGPNEMDTE